MNLNNHINFKKMIIIFIPLIAVLIINKVSFIQMIYLKTSWFFAFSFILFWFWAGNVFARLDRKKIINFLFGNSLWAISLILYIWQFKIVSETSRNVQIAVISQLYMTLIIPIVGSIARLFNDTIQITNIIIISYVLMFLIFAIGFFYRNIKNRV